MIRHIVMWTIKEADGRSKQQNIDLLKSKLLGLKNFIPQIKHIEVGTNSALALPDNYDITLVSDFATFPDLDIYQKHPEHLKVVELVKQIRVSRACIDFEY